MHDPRQQAAAHVRRARARAGTPASLGGTRDRLVTTAAIASAASSVRPSASRQSARCCWTIPNFARCQRLLLQALEDRERLVVRRRRVQRLRGLHRLLRPTTRGPDAEGRGRQDAMRDHDPLSPRRYCCGLVRSTLSRSGAAGRDGRGMRCCSPSSGCLKTISCGPIVSDRLPSGVSPTFWPSTHTSAHGVALRTACPCGSGDGHASRLAGDDLDVKRLLETQRLADDLEVVRARRQRQAIAGDPNQRLPFEDLHLERHLHQHRASRRPTGAAGNIARGAAATAGSPATTGTSTVVTVPVATDTSAGYADAVEVEHEFVLTRRKRRGAPSGVMPRGWPSSRTVAPAGGD